MKDTTTSARKTTTTSRSRVSVGWVIIDTDTGAPVRSLVGPSWNKTPGPAKVYRTRGVAAAYSKGLPVREAFIEMPCWEVDDEPMCASCDCWKKTRALCS